MKDFFFVTCCILFAATVHATQICSSDSIPASTPDSQFVDNGDGTVTDSKTGLMWKKCLEGISGDACESGSVKLFTWQQSLQQPIFVNNSGGFAGHSDWRIPNIKELISLIEAQCYDPAINLNRFPNTPSSRVWSGSPDNWVDYDALGIDFNYGDFCITARDSSYTVRLVRGGN